MQCGLKNLEFVNVLNDTKCPVPQWPNEIFRRKCVQSILREILFYKLGKPIEVTMKIIVDIFFPHSWGSSVTLYSTFSYVKRIKMFPDNNSRLVRSAHLCNCNWCNWSTVSASGLMNTHEPHRMSNTSLNLLKLKLQIIYGTIWNSG